MRDGIPYKLSLEFNKFGVLVSIGAEFERAGYISKLECLEISEREIDNMVSDYGRLTFQTPNLNDNDISAATPRETPAGNIYAVLFSEGEQFRLLPLRSEPSDYIMNDASENGF